MSVRLRPILAALLPLALTLGVAALQSQQALAGEIVYDQHNQIMAAGDDGSNPHVLVPLGAAPGMELLASPNVSPNGTTVVFAGQWNQWYQEWSYWSPPAPGAGGAHAIGIYRLANGTVTRLSLPPQSCHEVPATPCGEFETEPTIGPEGNVIAAYSFYLEQYSISWGWYVQVAYYALAHPPRAEQDSEGHSTLASPSPSDVQSPCAGSEAEAHPSAPALSPDGRLLAYGGCFSGETPAPALAVANADGSNTLACGIADSTVVTPSFSLDGTQVIAATQKGASPGLILFNLAKECENTSPTQVLTMPSGWAAQSPHFTADGRIVFVAMKVTESTPGIVEASQGNVYAISSACGQTGTSCQFPTDARQLTTGDGVYNVSWSSQTLTPATPATTTGGGGTPSGGGTTAATTTSSSTTTTTTKTTTLSPLTLSIGSSQLSVARGQVKVKLTCSGGAPGTACRGIVKLVVRSKRRARRRVHGHMRTVTITKSLVIAHGSYSVPSGSTQTVTLKLSHPGLAQLGHSHGHRMVASALATITEGSAGAQNVVLKLAGSRK